MSNSLQTFVYNSPDTVRVDTFLALTVPELTRSHIKKLIEEGKVLVNDKEIKPSAKLQLNDTVLIDIPSLEPQTLAPSNSLKELSIIFEDKDILVLNKPAGIIVHPNQVSQEDTLIQIILSKYPNIANVVYDPTSSLSLLRPGIVHRLDKDTSGVIVIAKTLESLHSLSQQFQEHIISKEYRALVLGNLSEPKTVHTAIRRKPARQNLMGVSLDLEEGREAITHFEPITQYHLVTQHLNISLIGCRIETGRTHQIRVHCKYNNTPVLGDQLYTNKTAERISGFLHIKRQMLHAASLTIHHPQTREALTFTADYPEDFKEAISRAEKAAQL